MTRRQGNCDKYRKHGKVTLRTISIILAVETVTNLFFCYLIFNVLCFFVLILIFIFEHLLESKEKANVRKYNLVKLSKICCAFTFVLLYISFQSLKCRPLTWFISITLGIDLCIDLQGNQNS